MPDAFCTSDRGRRFTSPGVIDGTTPQYGFVGIGLRHIARPAKPLLGTPAKTTTFQWLAAGPAYLFDGRRFEVGLGVHGSLAYLVWGSTGVPLDLSAQIYDVSRMATNTLVTFSVAFTLSPIVDVRRSPPQPWRSTTPRELPGACEDSSVYQSELAALHTTAMLRPPPICTLNSLNSG